MLRKQEGTVFRLEERKGKKRSGEESPTICKEDTTSPLQNYFFLI